LLYGWSKESIMNIRVLAVFKHTLATLCIGAPLSLFVPACAADPSETTDLEMEEVDEEIESTEQAVIGSVLKVRVGTSWKRVGCSGGTVPKANGSTDTWTIVDRKLKNQNGIYLHCSEGWTSEKKCQCVSGGSEAYHAITKADMNVDASKREHGNSLSTKLAALGTMYIFPNNAHEFCLAVNSSSEIFNKDGGDDGNHHESTHAGKCNEWCFGGGCPK
jgi:hypothetical protein